MVMEEREEWNYETRVNLENRFVEGARIVSPLTRWTRSTQIDF